MTELKPDDCLIVGQTLRSPDGKSSLSVNTFGHFCITKEGRTTCFYTAFNLRDIAYLEFSGYDRGNIDSKGPQLRLVNSRGDEVWRSDNRESNVRVKDRRDWDRWQEYTWEMKDAGREAGPYQGPNYDDPKFLLRDDGNACIWYLNDNVWESKNRKSSWYSGPLFDTLSQGQSMTKGSMLWSQNLKNNLEYEELGNMVLYIDGKKHWHSDTHLMFRGNATMQADGGLVVTDDRGNKVNVTKLSVPNTNGWRLLVQNDGNLVVYLNEVPKWDRFKA